MAVDVGKLIAESIDGFYSCNAVLERMYQKTLDVLESLSPGIKAKLLSEGPDWDNYDDDDFDDGSDGAEERDRAAGDEDEDDDAIHDWRMKNDPGYRKIHKDSEEPEPKSEPKSEPEPEPLFIDDGSDDNPDDAGSLPDDDAAARFMRGSGGQAPQSKPEPEPKPASSKSGASGTPEHRKGYQAGWVASKRGKAYEDPAEGGEYAAGYKEGYDARQSGHAINKGLAGAKEVHAKGHGAGMTRAQRTEAKRAAAKYVEDNVRPHINDMVTRLHPHISAALNDGQSNPQSDARASEILATWATPSAGKGNAIGGRSAMANAIATKFRHHDDAILGLGREPVKKDFRGDPAGFSDAMDAHRAKRAEAQAAWEAGSINPEVDHDSHQDHASTFVKQLTNMGRYIEGQAGVEGLGARGRQQGEAGLRSAINDRRQGTGAARPSYTPEELKAMTPKERAQVARDQTIDKHAEGALERARDVQAAPLDPVKQRAAGDALGRLAMGSEFDAAQHGDMSPRDAIKAYQGRALARAERLLTDPRLGGNKGRLGVFERSYKDPNTGAVVPYTVNMGDWLRSTLGAPAVENPKTGQLEAGMFKRGSGADYFRTVIPNYTHSGPWTGILNGLRDRATQAWHTHAEIKRHIGEEPQAHAQRVAARGDMLRTLGHPALQPISVDKLEVQPPPGIAINNNQLDPVKLMADWQAGSKKPGRSKIERGAVKTSKSMADAVRKQIPQWDRITSSLKGLKGEELTSHEYYPFWHSIVGRDHKLGKQTGSVAKRAENAINHNEEWHVLHPALKGFSRQQGAHTREHDPNQDQRLVEDDMLALFRGWLGEHVNLHPGRLDIIITELRALHDEQVFYESVSLRLST
jgi:hypothetical protein